MSIQCQTVISKLLGTFDGWRGRLLVSKKCGYNMIHFTPIQELGGSQSAYSIKNQLNLNPAFNSESKCYQFEDVAQLVEEMHREWSILSVTDIVLNHTANETPWLQEHPECAYNLRNSPHLRPAYLLDRILWQLTLDIISGKWKDKGLTIEINSEHHLWLIEKLLHEHYLSQAKIEEFYLINVNRVCDDFRNSMIQIAQCTLFYQRPEAPDTELILIQDAKYRRYRSKVDTLSVLNMFAHDIPRSAISKNNLEERCAMIKVKLEEINTQIKERIQGHLNAAVSNVIAQIRYERLADHGPKVKLVTRKNPLVTQYFTSHEGDRSLEDEEKVMYDDKCVHVMIHNGWVMGGDPLKNFADADSFVYLRRELIAWGDSVKLRYGDRPDDCPYLWNLMEKYVNETARIFHGIRLDNCHSTPIHVAEYMLDCARKVRPELYVFAELFTSSEECDNLFVTRLSIDSLIRESLAAPDSHELGRFIHRFGGGDPVGSFEKITRIAQNSFLSRTIIFDMTHDNESPMQKRSVFDYLPSAALVAMSCSAIGSARGYDELVPHHIHVVDESRPYAYWTDNQGDHDHQHVSFKDGIMFAKKIFNELHQRLAREGYCEIFVDQVNYDVVAVTRHNPETHKSIILVSHTCFHKTDKPWETGYIRPLTVSGHFNKIIFEAKMQGEYEDFKKASHYINGLKKMSAVVKEDINLDKSEMVKITSCEGENKIEFTNFTPGSVIAFDVELEKKHLQALETLHNVYGKKKELEKIFDNFTFDDLNFLLFRTDQEEKDEFKNGVYSVPNFAAFNYCGLAGIMYHWKKIRAKNDLGHPICNNLRDGLWLPNYILARLSKRKSSKALGKWLTKAFTALSDIPTYLRPRYFDVILTYLYALSLRHLSTLLPEYMSEASPFTRSLVFGSLALVGFNPSSPLPTLSSDLTEPKPEITLIEDIPRPKCPTIAAGLPHFASGFMRNWGRDTFISLRGLLLVTGRFDEARYIIIGFAETLRHGLIPNLLDKASNARYNCRDAVWWWLKCIKDFTEMAPNGANILKEPVKRIFPTDDSPAKLLDGPEQPLYDVIQEAITRHFEGLVYQERNAGPAIDAHMTEQGFTVEIGVDKTNGLVFGGNEWNCGTWMDKMGSSQKAGTKGKPSSPRDGSAVELVGLSKCILTWLAKLNKSGKYPYESVTGAGLTWKWDQWADLIQQNFEKFFWVDPASTDNLVNRREIYKDSYNATHRWQDFQFRPNFLIAMVVAPELFSPSRALRALELTEEILLGPLGMKTLDPSDWNYRGDYFNDNDSCDASTAHGFNYHQGPEWLWPYGFFLRSLYTFSPDKSSTVHKIIDLLSNHTKHIESSSWFGLPELTNSNGQYCPGSCHIQAWSHATLLETLYDIRCL